MKNLKRSEKLILLTIAVQILGMLVVAYKNR